MRHILLGLQLLLFPVGCGEVVVLDEDPPPILVALPDGAAPDVDGCTPPNLVPRGSVWLGYVAIDNHGEVAPWPCGEDAFWMGSRRFTEGPVFLDVDEAPTVCYGACVHGGACAPLDGEVVALDRANAEAFCAFRGGRLPSVPELQRATQGDALSFGPPALYEEWRACYFDGFASTECKELKEHAFGAAAPFPRDVGPFGHRDLFGGLMEFTLSKAPIGDDEISTYCSTPDGAAVPLVFSSSDIPLTFGPEYRLWSEFESAIQSNDKPWGPEPLMSFYAFDEADEATLLRGIRCAYDPAP